MRKVLFVALLCGVVAFGCKQKKKKVPPFRVVLTSPANGDKNVPIDAQISVQFSLPVDTATVSGNFSVEDASGTSIAGTTSWFADNTILLFTPSSNLAANTKFTVTLTSAIKSRSGLSLASHKFSFTTGSSIGTGPYVVATTPPDGANDVPFNKRVKMTVYFSRDMNASTITSATISLEGPSGSISVSVNQVDARTYEFTPQSDLQSATQYTLHITTGCQDTSGNALVSEFTATFRMVDITPEAVEVPAGSQNPTGYVNAACASAATVRVNLKSGMRSGDTISVSVSDGANTATKQSAYTADPQDFTFDLSALSDGSLTLEAWVVRYGVEGEHKTATAEKDTVAPALALSSPSAVPQNFTLSTLTLWFNVSEAGLLEAEVTDGAAQVVTASASAAGDTRIDIPLYIASQNNITVRFSDEAGNYASPLSYTVTHRGGIRKVAGTQELKVWVYDWYTLEPIQNAVVVLGDTATFAQTDANGLVTFTQITTKQTVTVYYPPSLGHPRYGKTIFTIYDVEPGCVSVPLGFDAGNDLVRVQGSVSNPPSAGRPYAQPSEDWTDDDITDGDYEVMVPAQRFVAFSFFGMDTSSLPDRHAFLTAEPQTAGTTVTQNVTLPANAETPETILQTDIGKLTVPQDFMLQDTSQGQPPVFAFVAAKVANVEAPAICGWGTFPTSVSSNTFTYSTSDMKYFRWDGADEYFIGVYARDVFGREFKAFARSANPPTTAPDLTFLDEPEIVSPQHGSCPATLTPNFQLTSVLSRGFYLVKIEAEQSEWDFVVPHTLTQFRVPFLDETQLTTVGLPPTVLQFGKTVSATAEAFEPETFDWTEWAIGDNIFACARYATSRPNLFMPADTSSTGEAIAGFGITGGPLVNSTLTVKVMDWMTHNPIKDAIVYVGNYSASGAVNTDSDGIAKIQNLTGPVTLTVVGPVGSTYSYVTVYDLNATYVSILLRDLTATPSTFTLWGNVNNISAANGGWVHLPNVDKDDLCNFDIYHNPSNTGPQEPDPMGNTSADSVPDNYSFRFPQAADGITYGFTAFDTAGASGDYKFTNIADWAGQIAPSGSPLAQQVDLTFPTTPKVFAPIKFTSSPSTVTLPSGLTNPTDTDADVTCYSADLTLGVEPLVGYGDTTATSNGFTYGITYGLPQSFEADWFMLRLGAKGAFATNDEWETGTVLSRLTALPPSYDVALPPIPRVLTPSLGQNNSSPPSQILFENAFNTKKGFYAAMLTGQSATAGFLWLLVKPVPSSGSQVQMILPSLPPTHAGPSAGMDYQLEVNAISRRNFNKDCWFLPVAKGADEPSKLFVEETATNKGSFTVP